MELDSESYGYDLNPYGQQQANVDGVGSGISGFSTLEEDPHNVIPVREQPEIHVLGHRRQRVTSAGRGPHDVRLSPKQQKKMKRRAARQARDMMKTRRKGLKIRARMLANEINKGELSSGVKMTSVQRLEKHQELTQLQGRIKRLSVEIHAADVAQRGKWANRKAATTKAVADIWGATITKQSGEARSATLPNTAALNPFTWITWCTDLAWLSIHSKNLVGDLFTRKSLCALADEGHKRLKEIEALRGSPAFSEALSDEEQKLRELLQPIEEEIEKIDIAEDIKVTAWAAGGTAASTGYMIFGVSSLMTMLNIGSEFFGVIAPIAGLVTAPIAIGMTALGIGNTTLNIQACRRDIKESALLRDEMVPEAVDRALDLGNIITLPEMDDPALSHMRDDMRDEQATLQEAKQRIHTIDATLLRGGLDEIQIRQLKHERHELEMSMYASLDQWIARLEELDPSANPNIKIVQSHFKARKVVLSSGLRMKDKIIPHIREKARVKVVQEYFQGAADVLALTATGLAVAGFVTSLAGGTGVPLLVAAGILASVSVGLRYGGGFLARQIVRWQQGSDRIKTKEFNHFFTDAMKNEEAHAADLEIAGLEDLTVSKSMFDILGKHYPKRPKNWSHLDWRKAVVEGGTKGKDAKATERALYSMRHRDHLMIINWFCFKFADGFLHRFAGGRRKKKREISADEFSKADKRFGRLSAEQRRRLYPELFGTI